MRGVRISMIVIRRESLLDGTIGAYPLIAPQNKEFVSLGPTRKATQLAIPWLFLGILFEDGSPGNGDDGTHLVSKKLSHSWSNSPIVQQSNKLFQQTIRIQSPRPTSSHPWTIEKFEIDGNRIQPRQHWHASPRRFLRVWICLPNFHEPRRRICICIRVLPYVYSYTYEHMNT